MTKSRKSGHRGLKHLVKEFLLHPMLFWNHRNYEDNKVSASEMCFRKMHLGRRRRRLISRKPNRKQGDQIESYCPSAGENLGQWLLDWRRQEPELSLQGWIIITVLKKRRALVPTGAPRLSITGRQHGGHRAGVWQWADGEATDDIQV